MILCMWMINAKWMFFGCDIIPKSQIQFKQSITFSCNRCNGIVWFPVCICIDEGLFIGIASPASENVICQFDQTFFIFMTDTDYRQWPFYNSSFHILISRNLYWNLNRCFCHCKCIMSPLEVIMT